MCKTSDAASFHDNPDIWDATWLVRLQGFSTFGAAVQTCFAMLLGNTDVNDDLKALTGLQGKRAVVGGDVQRTCNHVIRGSSV